MLPQALCRPLKEWTGLRLTSVKAAARTRRQILLDLKSDKGLAS